MTALVEDVGGGEEAPLETARLQRASALLKDGQAAAALDEIGPASERDSLRLRYARVLLTLHADRDLQFPKLRAGLAAILRADPFFRDVFDVWLGLNPSKPELLAYLTELKPRGGPVAAWQRAEAQLRLGDAREAVHALQGIGESDVSVFSRADRVLARAHFQLKEDAAGQAVYYGLLDRLDETSAHLLFRDIAAIASAAERQEFPSLGLEAKLRDTTRSISDFGRLLREESELTAGFLKAAPTSPGRCSFRCIRSSARWARWWFRRRRASETDGLTVDKRVMEEPPASTISEKVRVDLTTLKPGVYTVYVTVRDLRTREIVSRFLTFQVA